MMLDALAYSFIGIFLVYQILLWIWLKKTTSTLLVLPPDLPKIDVLVAARNEEANIDNCLQALTQLDYPSHLFQIYIGNDQSTDATADKVLQWQQRFPHIHLIHITEVLGTARGKANVLAHLAKTSDAEFLFITDADIQVPASWARTMLAAFRPTDGIISGSTIVEGKGAIARVQKMDWSYAFGMVYVVSEKGYPVSAVGNNMCIRKKAYEATGGYENLPFSITEDLELFLATLKKGYSFRQLMQAEVVATSTPQETWMKLLQQRKRWLTGALRVPLVLLVFLILQAFFFPVLVALVYYQPWLACLFYLSKTLLQYSFLNEVYQRIQKRYTWKDILIFEVYSYLFPVVVIIYQLWPSRIDWKGRKYSWKESQPQ
jgi:cellulose synthase/poly-beta-1,6-N-acetylglucosamine synthase-like glycosyltransferase